MGLGTATIIPTTSPAPIYLPSLRNGALGPDQREGENTFVPGAQDCVPILVLRLATMCHYTVGGPRRCGRGSRVAVLRRG